MEDTYSTSREASNKHRCSTTHSEIDIIIIKNNRVVNCEALKTDIVIFLFHHGYESFRTINNGRR